MFLSRPLSFRVSSYPSPTYLSRALCYKYSKMSEYKLPVDKLRSPRTEKTPLVLVACGSYSPVTFMHLRLQVMARDWMEDNGYEVLGAYFSPVADAYKKSGLAPAHHRVEMLRLATSSSDFIMVDDFETRQAQWTETVKVLRHFDSQVNAEMERRRSDGQGNGRLAAHVRVMLVCGSDLLDSFNTPNLWAEADQREILESFGVVAIERQGSDPSKIVWSNDLMHAQRSHIAIVKQWIPNDISSTLIRRSLARGLSVDYLLPEPVVRYIYAHKLYNATAKV